MRRCLEEDMDVVLIGVYLIHVALEVLLKVRYVSSVSRSLKAPSMTGCLYFVTTTK